MRWNYWSGLALAACFVVAYPLHAQDKSAPSVVIRVKSVEKLLATAAQFARLAGKQDETEQIEAFIKGKISDKGLEGIDISRPERGSDDDDRQRVSR